VQLVDKFRENADEHLQWARTAKSARERAVFESMAAAWIRAAAQAEARARLENALTK
jgi:hypothetical protein